MDSLQTRLKALEQHAHTVQRQLRWWRGLACGLIVLALLTRVLPAGTGEQQRLDQRVAALETRLIHFTRQGNEVFITGANLHLVNGEGATTTTNGLGNLIVGYNEPRTSGQDIRTGSHNVVVGQWHNFTHFGGLVVGQLNTISGEFASVSGGQQNTASARFASVSGGLANRASGPFASVSGGRENVASAGDGADGLFGFASVSGGRENHATNDGASVSGGRRNVASGLYTSVSGGEDNLASNAWTSVSGGQQNTASGSFASVSGGNGNTASGRFASIGGGLNRKAVGEFDWVAGSPVEDE